MTRQRFRDAGRRARAWLCLLIVALALWPQGAGASHEGKVYGTGGDGVWLRTAPGSDAPPIVALEEGTPFQLLEGPKRVNDEFFWARIAVDGVVGWMVAEFLLMDTSAPPVSTTPQPSAPEVGPAPPTNLLAPGGWAQVTGTSPTEGLRLRAAPAPWENLLALLPDGSALQVVDGPTTGGNGNPWYQVIANGATGWVDGTYLVGIAAPVALAPAEPVSAVIGLVAGGWAQVAGTAAAGGLRLRAAPAPWEALLTILAEGAQLRILEGPTTGGNGDPWYRIATSDATGWVDGIYLVPTGAPTGGTVTAPPGTDRGNALARAALAQVGRRYVWGGADPSGFDCSGLVLYLARQTLGITVPRVAAGQAFAGVHVDLDKLAPGDLVFYANTYAPGITHVGIYIGGNRWVTAEDEKTGVVVLSLDAPYWKARYAGARRIA